MGRPVILTPRALADLRSIVEYIALDNPERARSLGRELVSRALAIGEFPAAGRIVPEVADPMVREIIHASYRILYELGSKTDPIYVLRFWHAARGEPKII